MATLKKHPNRDIYANQKGFSTLDIVKILLNSLTNDRNKLIIRTFAETGCTSSELVNIKYADIDFEKNNFTINADYSINKKTRKIPVSKELIADIKKTANTQYLFESKNGTQLSTRYIRKLFESFSHIVNQKITSSEIRKAYLLNSIKQGNSFASIKKVAGIKQLDKKNFITKKEFKEIIFTVENKRDKLILNILFNTGCQLNELVNLKIEDVNFRQNQLTVNNDNPRTIIIPEALISEIKNHILVNKLSSEQFLISSRQSNRISDKRIFQIVKKYSKISGYNKTNPRILRNSQIVDAIASGDSSKLVSQKVGIENLGKISIYGSLISGKNE